MKVVYFFALVGAVAVFYLLIGAILSFRQNSPTVSLLLTVKNQEEVIEGFIRKILFWREFRLHTFEIVVVNDDSTDRTGEILTRMALQNSGLVHINSHLYPPEFSPIELGQRFCSGEVIIFCDLSRYEKPAEATKILDTFLRTQNVI